VREVYRFYTVPASNTAVGHIILENIERKTKRRRPASLGGAAARKRAAAHGIRQVAARSKR
jgi:protocatechuate 4,5-dioxygenase, beta chain